MKEETENCEHSLMEENESVAVQAMKTNDDVFYQPFI